MYKISFIATLLLLVNLLQACKQKGTDSLPDTEEEMRMEENPFSKIPGVAEQNSGGNSSQNQNQENNPTSDKAYWEKLDKDLGIINIAPTSIENSKDKIHSIHISKDRKTATVYYKSLPLVEELPVVCEKGANILEILMPTVKKSIINGKESNFMHDISAKKMLCV